jgi:hypothetical protein
MIASVGKLGKETGRNTTNIASYQYGLPDVLVRGFCFKKWKLFGKQLMGM